MSYDIKKLKEEHDHHPFFSPSAWPALEQCAFYRSSNKESKDSKMGTDFHKKVENFINGEGFDVTDDDVIWVGDKLNQDLSEYLAMIGDDEVHSELELDIPDPNTGEMVSWGYTDIVWVGDKSALVVDPKAGYKYKDYKKQLLAYALGVFHKFGVDKVTAKVYFVKLKKIEEYVWTKDEAAKEYTEFVTDLEERKKDMITTPNPMCMYCSNKNKCPAQRELAVSIISEIDEVQWKDPSDLQIENPADRKLLGQLLYAVKAVSDREDELREIAKKATDRGFDIPGIKVSEKKGARKITDPQKAFEISQIPAKEFIKTCRCTLGKLEKAYAKNKKVTQAKAEKELAEKLSTIIEQGEDSIVVKRIL